MRLLKIASALAALALVLSTTGCGTFVAERMAQAPNTYPTWFAPKARVMLGFSPRFLSNFHTNSVEIGPPAARLVYRVVPPADYHLKTSFTNWTENGEEHFDFTFKANVPGITNQWSAAPRGTVILLHGYGLAQFSMAPWALRLAEAGWRCVLVDLRGHGKSTGDRIYFGMRETHDLSQLLDKLARDGQLTGPVSAIGESYGASLALRWKTVEPRVDTVVAIAPYAVLSNAVLNISRDYAAWVPQALIRAGMKELPSVLDVPAAELDTTTVLRERPVEALFVGSPLDRIAPLADVQELDALAKPGSKLIVVPKATHESLPYFFGALATPVVDWLKNAPTTGANGTAVLPSPAYVADREK